MDLESIVREALAASEAGDLATVRQQMTDDFSFRGITPEPVGTDAYLGMMAALLKAAPDWRFNAKNFKVQGNKVSFTTQVSGTQTGTLDTHMPGMPVVPPTNKRFSLPPETNTVTFRGDKVASIEVTPAPHGGLMGILEQIGVSAPR